MGKFDGVLLASDYDGTLRPEDLDYVPKPTLEAIDYFCANGGLFTVCSGRNLPFFQDEMKYILKVNAPAIVSNGVFIYDDADDKILYEKELPMSARQDIASFQRMFPDCGFEVHKGTKVYVTQERSNMQYHLSKLTRPFEHADIEELDLPYSKFEVYLPKDENGKVDPQYADKVGRVLNEKYAAFLSDTMMDVGPKGITKGTGLLKLAEILKIKRENIYCIGDSWNDVPMIEVANIGFVPENGRDPVKRLGRVVKSAAEFAAKHVVEILDEIYD